MVDEKAIARLYIKTNVFKPAIWTIERILDGVTEPFSRVFDLLGIL